MLGAILEQGQAAPELGSQAAPELGSQAAPELGSQAVPGGGEPESSGDGAQNPPAASAPFGLAIPAPRAAAAAILAMLGFGVVLGSFANANVESLVRSVLVAVSPGQAAVPASTVAGTGSSATSGSSGGSSSPSSAGSPSAAAPSAASAPAQTQTTPSTGGGGTPQTGATGFGLPSVKHVFLIVLSDQGLNQTFGLASHDRYLSKTLPAQGELVQSYYAVAGSALANEVALISGQGPTVQTTANCPQFTAVTPAGKGAQGQILGDGCVYPLGTLTLGDELVANGQTWKAYIQGIGNAAPGQPATCRHPQLGAADADQVPRPGDPYVTWRNPFVYFSSIIDTGACNGSDVDLEQLATDLQSEAKTPTMSYIVPSACDDGTELACVAGAKSGLAAADGFLQGIVPQIEQSAAYKDHGLIAITFDEAPQSGPNADASSCCSQPVYPNLPAATSTLTTPAAAFQLASDLATSATTTAGTATDSGTTTTAGTPTDSGTTTTTTTTTSTSTSSITTTSAPTTTTTSGTVAPTTTSTTAAPASTTAAPATTAPPTTTASTTTTTTPTATGTGGGQVGLMLISPLIKPRTKDLVDQVNHYSLLATLADLFGVERLGYSKDAIAFDSSVFNASP